MTTVPNKLPAKRASRTTWISQIRQGSNKTIMIPSLSYYLMFWMIMCSVHPVAAGLRGGTESSTRDLKSNSTFKCKAGKKAKRAWFAVNVTVTGMTSDSQEETLASITEGIDEFLKGKYGSYVLGAESSLDMQVQTPCDEEVSKRRKLIGNFRFPIGGSCLYCSPDDTDYRRQLKKTGDKLEELGDALQFFLNDVVLATQDNPWLYMEVNLHEVATQEELIVELDNVC